MLLLLVQLVAGATAQDKGPDCAKARSYLTSAQAAIDAKDSGTALQELNQAIQVAPRCADAYLLLGLTEFHNGATADAIQHYQKALLLQPRSYSAHYDLALAYLKEQKLPEARAQLEEAVKLDPSQPDAIYNLGIVLQELGHPADALIKFQRAKALDPKRPDVTFNIVRAELELGQVAAARTEARDSAKQFGTDSQWCAAIGQLFLRADHPKEAVAYLQRAFRGRPKTMPSFAINWRSHTCNPDKRTKSCLRLRIRKRRTIITCAPVLIIFPIVSPKPTGSPQQALDLAPDSPQIWFCARVCCSVPAIRMKRSRWRRRPSLSRPIGISPTTLPGVSSYFLRLYEEAVKNLARAAGTQS